MSDSPPRARSQWRLPVEWLGILPFVAFALLFLILPTMKIVIGAFQAPDGGLTLQNLIDLNTDSIRNAYWISIKLSVIRKFQPTRSSEASSRNACPSTPRTRN